MYLRRCTDEQIKELMHCYAENYTEIIINRDRRGNGIDVELVVDCMTEQYVLYDYNVEVYDWDDTNTDCLKNYRRKMLSYFGNQYAIDYLIK